MDFQEVRISVKKTQISQDLMWQLRCVKLASHFRSTAAAISGKRLESDGRRRGGVLRRLLDAGFIRKIEGDAEDYEVLEVVLTDVETTELNLMEEWTANYRANNNREAYRRPWISFEHLTVEKQLAAVNDVTLDWFVVAQDPYRYMHGFAETAQTVGDLKHRRSAFNRYWNGPFQTIRHVTECLETTPGTCVAVSSLRLRESVGDFLLNQRRQWLFANNLLEGLAGLGLVSAHRLKNDDGTAAIDAQLVEGYGLLGLTQQPENKDEVAWETNLTESIARLESGIRHREHKLRILHEIDQAINRYGGWPFFKEAFWNLLCQSAFEETAGE